MDKMYIIYPKKKQIVESLQYNTYSNKKRPESQHVTRIQRKNDKKANKALLISIKWQGKWQLLQPTGCC